MIVHSTVELVSLKVKLDRKQFDGLKVKLDSLQGKLASLEVKLESLKVNLDSLKVLV